MRIKKIKIKIPVIPFSDAYFWQKERGAFGVCARSIITAFASMAIFIEGYGSTALDTVGHMIKKAFEYVFIFIIFLIGLLIITPLAFYATTRDNLKILMRFARRAKYVRQRKARK